MSNKDYKFGKWVGIGGIKCACCIMWELSTAKKILNRAFRRRMKILDKKDLTD